MDDKWNQYCYFIVTPHIFPELLNQEKMRTSNYSLKGISSEWMYFVGVNDKY